MEMVEELAKRYEHKAVEKKWQHNWFSSEIYYWQEEEGRENNFVIDTPPPTVSGMLHMGHVFSYTQADFIARFQRMRGKNVFYPMGFDDNGLPTERLVEKIKKVRAHNMPREEFVKLCREVVQESEEEFRNLFKSIALSIDWRQEYQTISPRSTALSQMSFLDLYHKDLAYRNMQPTLWDSVDQTALAQADIVDGEQKTYMNDIVFTDQAGQEYIIATTRPELLGACVAIFFHPDDQRYQHLAGQELYTPLFEAPVSCIADSKVEIEKGTGLVMCCTFGDITDSYWWRTHNLPLRIIIDKRGKLYNLDKFGTENWPSKNPKQARHFGSILQDLKIKEAREKIIEVLRENNLLKAQTEINNIVKCGERSNFPLEILVTPQWCVKVLDYKEELLEKAQKCTWYPEYMRHRLENWIDGLQWDWCISRQRFFGVPFPVWYSKRKGEEGKILVADKSQLPVDPLKDLPIGYSRDEVEADVDVMDTWATSAVSPQLNSWAINDDWGLDLERHRKLFPADLRPQAHEIIRTWAFYTLVKAHHHDDSIPWKNLMISGWCLAADKTKMSKSKGNIVTPVNLIEEKGADVVRYWASHSRLGADIAYSEETFKLGNKLLTKLWNASKFVASHFAKIEEKYSSAKEAVEAGKINHQVDLWIISALYKTIQEATEQLEKFEYCLARQAIEKFFWNDFCDNYLEIVKIRVYNEQRDDPKGQMSAIYSLYFCLESIFKLFALYLPHITEELNQIIFQATDSIHKRGNWPIAEKELFYSEEALEQGYKLVAILDVVRRFKAEHNMSLKVDLAKITLEGKTLSSDITQGLQDVTVAHKIEYAPVNDELYSEENNYKIAIYRV